MTNATFKPGDDVMTPDGRGTVIDLRPAPSGSWIFGVEDADGRVAHFTVGALRHADGSPQD